MSRLFILVSFVLTLGISSSSTQDRKNIIDGFQPLNSCRSSALGFLPPKVIFENLNERLFAGLKVECLDLKSRGIQQISNGFFKKLPTLRVINLEGNSLNINEFFQTHDLLSIQSLSLDQNNQLDTLKITGLYPNLKHLQLQNLGLRNFEFPFSSSLTHLYLSKNNLSRGILKIPGSVTHLFLDKNSLTKLPTEQTNPNVLSVSGNLFEKIGCTERPRVSSLCLRKFRNLERLFLGSNDVFEIEPSAFDGIANLQTLDLSSNHLEKLDQNCLSKVSSLKSLNLSGNPLTQVPRVCELVNLEVLILDHTRIVGVTESEFCQIKKLKELWLNDAGISRISVNSFGNLISLEELHLGENQLSTLQGWQVPFSLRRLYLHGNLFKSLADATRIGTAFLEYLDLRGNQITHVQEHSFNVSKLRIDM